jgi:hypothetical protein
MSLLDKILTFAKVSDGAKPWVTSLATIGGLIMAVGGVKDFLVKNQLTSVQDIYRVIFVTDRHTEIQPILRKTAIDLRADRAFIFLYKQNEKGEWFTEFVENYQWQISGQTHIKNALYPIKAGADKDRFEAMNTRLCKETIVAKLGKSDFLGIAMKNSGVVAQVACQVTARVYGKERTGAIAVEFSNSTYNKTLVEEMLIEASINVEKAFR